MALLSELRVAILALLCTFAPVFALSGSCIEAGYTECCSNGCFAEPYFCSCDPTCELYGDCCSDIYQLCDPTVELAHNAFRPAVVYLDSVTFHTAMIHWIVNPRPQDAINGTYQVAIYAKTNVSDSWNETSASSFYSIPIAINITEMDELGWTFHVPLSGLDQGTRYSYRIGIISDVKIIEGVAQGTFRTEQYPSVNNTVTLTLSPPPPTVTVHWMSVKVPPGVSIMHYNVQYDETENPAPMGVVHTLSPEEVSLTVQGLKGHRHYVFRVSVVIREIDGGLHEVGASEESLEIFVPDMVTIQLVAKLSLSCENWNMQQQQQVTISLHSKITDLLNESCTYPVENLLNETVTPLCHNDSIYLTYRVTLFSVQDCSVDNIIYIIQNWEEMREQIFTSDDITLQLSRLGTCPTRIRYHNTPYCLPQEVDETGSDVATTSLPCDQSSNDDDFTSMLVTYLLVEFGMLTVFYLTLLVAIICIMKMRLNNRSKQDRHLKSISHSSSLSAIELQAEKHVDTAKVDRAAICELKHHDIKLSLK